MPHQELYNSIDYGTLCRFVDEQQEEHLSLEFKLVTEPAMNRNDRLNFAQALSGFANSSGGIVAWGVNARRGDSGVDCARDLRPIENVALLLTRLNELTGQFISPKLEGVLHKKIDLGDGTGFVISYIPESDAGPHMAKGGEDRYYKRSGDSFYKMEHFDIEDMFGRRKKPNLSLQYKVRLGMHDSPPSWAHVFVTLQLINQGRGTAVHPYMEIERISHAKLKGLNGPRKLAMARLQVHGKAFYCNNDFTVIHPNTYVDVDEAQIIVSRASQKIGPVEVAWRAYAQDAQTTSGVLVITPEEIIDVLPWTTEKV